MNQYATYQSSTQNYGTSYSPSTSYTSASSYKTADIVIQGQTMCDTFNAGGRCEVCRRHCMIPKN